MRDKCFLAHDDCIENLSQALSVVILTCVCVRKNPLKMSKNHEVLHFRCCPVYTPSVAPACGSTLPGFPSILLFYLGLSLFPGWQNKGDRGTAGLR